MFVVVVVAALLVVPGAAQASTSVSGTISSDTTWTTGGSPYVATGNVTVASGVTLTIDPGVYVKFGSGFSLVVDGSLVANGTSGSPIMFTSIEDDSDGNDSSGDGPSTGSPGDWGTLGFDSSTSSGTISHAVVEYGGDGLSPLNDMVSASDGGTLSVSDSTITDSEQTGAAVGSGGEIDFERTKVASNGGYGVGVTDGVLSMSDSAVWLNGSTGVHIAFSTPPSTRSEITGSSVWANTGEGIYTNLSGAGSGPTPDGSGNNIYDNGSMAPGASLTQLDISQRADADWSGNYWGPVADADCSGDRHLEYAEYATPGASSGAQLGPVSSTLEEIGSSVCAFDSVLDTPVAAQQIDTFFKTPPAVFGGVNLQQLFGCAACTAQFDSMLDGMRGVPGSPASQMPGPVNYVGDPVNPATGTLTETSDDVHVNGPGVPFDFVRTYNSRDTDSGIFGVGWSSTYEASLSFPDSSTVVYRSGDGQQSTFVKIPFGPWYGIGIPAQLAKVDDGGGDYHWTLASTDQRVFSFNEAGQLTSIAPRFTAPTTLSHNGSGQLTDITDAAGRDIQLGYNLAGLLTSVTLPDTRSVGYSYTSGRLTGVTDLRGKSWTLSYDANGYLDSIEDPNSHYPMRATLNSSGQVTSEENANGDSTTYAYSTEAPFAVTTVTPPGRGAYVYEYFQNLLVSKTDPLGHTTSYTYDRQHNVASITDPRGNTTTMQYDPLGNLVEEDAPSPLSYTQNWTYNSTGEILTYTDGRGHATAYTYSTLVDYPQPKGELKTITDPDGNTTTYTYYQPGAAATEVGLLHTVQDARGKTTTYAYDADGNESSTTTPMGNQTTTTYDSSGRMLTSVDPRGNAPGGTPSDYTTSWTYNDANQVVTTTDARGHTTNYTYDDAGNLETMHTPDGLTSYAYSDANQLTSTEDPRGNTESRTYEPGGKLASLVTPQGSKTTYAYDSAGELTSTVTPRGYQSGATASDYIWTYGYDADGDQTSASHPDAGTSTTTYDALDRPTVSTDPLGHTTTVTYDGDGNVTRRTHDLGEHWDYTYDGENRELTATDPRGKTTANTYEPTGQLETTTTAAGDETSYTFNNDELLSTMVTPRGNVTGGTPADFTWTYGYDPAGNQTSIQDADGNPATTQAYDANNDLTSVETPRRNTTSYTYDAMDRLASVIAPGTGSPTTTYTYDADGDLAALTTPDSGVTTWTYDDDGNPLTKTTPVGEWQTTYNADNTPATVEAPSTGTATYTYDRMARTTETNYSDSTPTVSYTYDHAGRTTSMTDGQGEQDYTYDDDNRLTEAARGSDAFEYEYSDGLNLTDETYPNGTTLANTFTNDELLHTTTANSASTTFTYTPDDQLNTTTYPSGVGYTETRGYDHDGNLDSVANTNGSGTLSSFAWTLNDDGAPSQIATTRGATTTNEALTYDPMDRLTEACYSTTTCTAASNTTIYAYDGDSNITQQVRAGSVPNPGTTNYTYNTADQLTQAAVSGAGATSYTYDANGDLASAGSDSYTYNLADELASTTQGSTTTNYSYDGYGNRVESDTSGGADTTFTWDMIGQLPEIASEQTGSGTALRTYLYGPQGAISITTPSQTSYLYRDPLGSITDSTSSSGSAQWQFSYDPYGNPITTTDVGGSSPTEPLRYAGQYLDPELGQYDMRAREYDPASLRFDSPDPLAAALTQPYAGAYVYAGADPAAQTDPTGMMGGAPTCAATSAGCGTLSTDPLTQYLGGVSKGVEQTILGAPSAMVHEGVFLATTGCYQMPEAVLQPNCVEHNADNLLGTGTTLWDCASGTSESHAEACGHVVAIASAAALGAAFCPAAAEAAATETAGAEDVLATPGVDNSSLQNIVNDLYKGTTNPYRIGNGTTADAVRAEEETGQPTGGVFHTMKAEQYSTALTKLLQSGNLSVGDSLVAQSLLNDLRNALGNRP